MRDARLPYPMIDAIGSWRPLATFPFSPWLPVCVRTFCLISCSKSTLFFFGLSVACLLKSLLASSLLSWNLLRAFSPAFSLFPKVLELDACESGSHRDFVLVSCFDEEAQRLFGQCGFLLSSCVRPRLSSTGLSGVAGGTLACWERPADDTGEAASGLRCGGGMLVVQTRRAAAHLGDFLLRLRRQLCRQRCCSPYLLTLLVLSLSLSAFHTACPQALHARYLSWARASSSTTCALASVPIVGTSAPRTTSPVGAWPNPVSTNHDELHDTGPVREGVREAGFVLFVFQLGVYPLQPFKPPFTSSFLTQRTKRKSWVQSTSRSSSAVACRCEPPASMPWKQSASRLRRPHPVQGIESVIRPRRARAWVGVPRRLHNLVNALDLRYLQFSARSGVVFSARSGSSAPCVV